jgi:hypothetical protein
MSALCGSGGHRYLRNWQHVVGNISGTKKLLAEAENFVGSDINFSVDYAKALGMAAVKRSDDALLKDAFDRFEHIYQKAPQNTKNWAIILCSA